MGWGEKVASWGVGFLDGERAIGWHLRDRSAYMASEVISCSFPSDLCHSFEEKKKHVCRMRMVG